MGAMLSFQRLSTAIGLQLEREYDAAVDAGDSGADKLPRMDAVQPVYLRGDVDIEKIHVSYRRSGAGSSSTSVAEAFNRRSNVARPEAVVVEWAAVAQKWQDAEDVNEKIVEALIDDPTALAHPEAYLSGAVDDVIELGGQDDSLYVVTQSALLVDADW